tara:strand:- start:819 stop:1127 length:309 start_codon:yes stop_codon:yes gene_type:complete
LYPLGHTGKQTQQEETKMNGHMTMKIRNQQRWERSRAYQKKRTNGYHQRLQAKALKAQQATQEEQPYIPLLETEGFLLKSAYAEQKPRTSEPSSEITTELKL